MGCSEFEGKRTASGVIPETPSTFCLRQGLIGLAFARVGGP